MKFANDRQRKAVMSKLQKSGKNTGHGLSQVRARQNVDRKGKPVYRITKDDFTRINNDVNGNPRYVFHFTELISDRDRDEMEDDVYGSYEYALQKAKFLGGRKFHNKQYGGGIVVQSYNIDDTAKRYSALSKKTLSELRAERKSKK